MKRLFATACAAAIPVFAGTSLREPVSGLAAFQVLPVSAFPSQSAGLCWASEGHAQLMAGSGSMYALAVTAPHLRISYAGDDLDLRDPQTGYTISDLRRSEFNLGTGIAISQLGLAMGGFDLAIGGDLVRAKSRDLDASLPSRLSSWVDPSFQMRWGAARISASLKRVIPLETDSGIYRDPVVDVGFGAVRENGLQWGVGTTIPLADDREFGLQVGAEKTFSQALSFRVEGTTLYRKSYSKLVADSGQRKWIRSGLGLAVGTTLRFRPWLSDRDPSWIQPVVDPFQGTALGHFLYDWEIGAVIELDALSGKSTAGVTVGRWF